MSLEIDKMLQVSTAHITLEQLSELNRLSYGYQNNDAIILYTGLVDPDWSESEEADEFDESLVKLLAFARDQGCAWLKLDPDVEPLKYLKTYEH